MRHQLRRPDFSKRAATGPSRIKTGWLNRSEGRGGEGWCWLAIRPFSVVPLQRKSTFVRPRSPIARSFCAVCGLDANERDWLTIQRVSMEKSCWFSAVNVVASVFQNSD